jgi:hypothetical protein
MPTMPSCMARATRAAFVAAGRPLALYLARIRCRIVRKVAGAIDSCCAAGSLRPKLAPREKEVLLAWFRTDSRRATIRSCPIIVDGGRLRSSVPMHIAAGRHVHVRIDQCEHGARARSRLWIPPGGSPRAGRTVHVRGGVAGWSAPKPTTSTNWRCRWICC